MNKILNNFEAASTGNYEPSKQESNEMKTILESFYDVAHQDETEAEPQQLDEIASVTMSGDSADEVARLAKLMNGSDEPQTAAYQGPPDMPPKEPTVVTPRVMDDIETGEEQPVEEDDWDNSPEPSYDDHHKMTKDLSGGLNRQKKSYPPTNGGDNPMALENSLAEELSSMLKSKMAEQDQDGDGDEDFADVQIARMMASGMSKEEAKKKVKDKKYNEGSYKKKKKTDDEEVAEDDDDPCWKNYKMVGTKKKNGKEVPNCVPKEGVEEAAPKNNPVAKNAGKFNKAQTHKDKKKAQKRGEQKHKGKDMAMESPVFDRYVKPFLDKTPSQIVEFYDREALNIINRLSQERRALHNAGANTQMHESVIGKLREGLSALPEKTLNEVRRRGYRGRSSWDPNMQGYGPSRRSLGSFGDEDRGANDEVAGDRFARRQQQGPFYLRIDGKTYKQKGQPKEFSNKKGVEGYGRAMMKNNPDLKGRITIARTPEDRA